MKWQRPTLKFLVGIFLILIVFCGSNYLAKRFEPQLESEDKEASTKEKKEVEQQAEIITISRPAPVLTDSSEAKQAYQKAISLLPTRLKKEGLQQLNEIIEHYPDSKSADNALKVLGEVKLDNFFNLNHSMAKKVYKVSSGDSFLKIANQCETSIENMLRLNSLVSYNKIKQGDNLVIMPLYFNLVIDLKEMKVVLEYGKKPVKYYDIVKANYFSNMSLKKTLIQSVYAVTEANQTVLPISEAYRNAHKTIQIKNLNLSVTSTEYPQKENFTGILLHPSDIEELVTLLRKGNLVEIRY